MVQMKASSLWKHYLIGKRSVNNERRIAAGDTFSRYGKTTRRATDSGRGSGRRFSNSVLRQPGGSGRVRFKQLRALAAYSHSMV